MSTDVVSQNLKQNVFASGTITTITDTIKGFILYDEGYLDHVYYKLDKGNKQTLKINIEHVQQIKVATSNYIKIEYKGKKHLMKLLAEGNIKLCEFTRGSRSALNNNYSNASGLQTNNYAVHAPKKSKLFLVKDDKVYKVKRRKLKNLLKEIMVDERDFHERINDLDTKGSLYEYHLKKLIANYNFWYKRERY